MSTEQGTDEHKHRESVAKTAESTRFRDRSDTQPQLTPPPKPLRRGSDTYFGPPQSIRLHHSRPSRGGLTMRLALPIIAAVTLALLGVAFIVRGQLFSLQLDDLKSDAADAVYTTGLFGRLLLIHRDKFLLDNPEYLRKAEWKAGNHWLVSHGFVSPEDWSAATGFQLDEYAPASVMDQAGRKTILGELDRLFASQDIDSELVYVSLFNADGSVLAASGRRSFRFDVNAVKSVPFSEDGARIGNAQIQVDYLAAMEPQPLVRGVARLYANDGETRIGSAIVILRTDRHDRQQKSLFLLLLGVAVVLALLMAAVCWYSARRVINPMRRLAADMQAIAEGDYTRRAAVRENDEMGLLAQAFNSMAERLRLARLNEQETSRLESDLSIARDIQNNLLPPQTPRVRGLDIHTAYRPAKEIGGDYFDFLPVDGEHMGLVVADASGKSIPAALVMSTTRAILRFVAPGSQSAAETLTRANAILSVDIPRGMFVTAYYVILDPRDNTMLCASAGHTPLLIARGDGSVELMNPGGIALGFDGGPIFQRSIREQRVRLERGDRVLLYTDGVVECVNIANEEYSDRRLREFLRRNRELSSHDFVGALMADLDRHRGTADMRDDTTIVTFKVL